MKSDSENTNFNLRHLRAVHAIWQEGSFVRAAERLGVVPSALTETVRQIVGAAHHDLLEDLAQTIADTLFADPRVKRLDLTLDKLTALEDAESVGVSLSRWR